MNESREDWLELLLKWPVGVVLVAGMAYGYLAVASMAHYLLKWW